MRALWTSCKEQRTAFAQGNAGSFPNLCEDPGKRCVRCNFGMKKENGTMGNESVSSSSSSSSRERSKYVDDVIMDDVKGNVIVQRSNVLSYSLKVSIFNPGNRKRQKSSWR